jgi:hypothetical protein
MDAMTRIYHVVTGPEKIQHDWVRELVPRKNDLDWEYWRQVLRMAAVS